MPERGRRSWLLWAGLACIALIAAAIGSQAIQERRRNRPEPRSPHPDQSRPPRSDSMMAGCVEEDPDAPMTPPPHVAELLAADAEGEEEFRRKKELNAYGI